MRVAVLSDIHGNLAALEAVLAQVAQLAPDLLVIAGDIVNGAPDSAACLDLVESTDAILLRGNHERYLFDYGTGRAEPEWESERFGAVRWARAAMGGARLARLRSLPLQHCLAGPPELLVVHASPRADNDNLLAHTPTAEIERMFGGDCPRTVVRGHNHAPAVRPFGGRTLITSGSVGMPLDGAPTAKFVLLEAERRSWQVCHLAVPYDVDATLARFRESGYLDEAGPMVRLLMREIATGSHQMVPFLRRYREWSDCVGGPPPLGAAIHRFLNEF